MLIFGNLKTNKTEILIEKYSELLNSGVSSDEILVLVQNSKLKNEFIEKTKKLLKIEAITKFNIYSYFGLCYNKLLEFYPLIEEKINYDGVVVSPKTCGLEASRYIFKNAIDKIHFKGYNSKVNLLHQLLRRLSLITMNVLSDDEIKERTKILKESFTSDVNLAINMYKKETLKYRAFDYLRQAQLFSYIFKNSPNPYKYVFLDDADEITPLIFDYLKFIKKDVKEFFIAADKKGGSRVGYLCAQDSDFEAFLCETPIVLEDDKKGDEIYNNISNNSPVILENLKTIADEMSEGEGTDNIGDGDFLFGGDVQLWRKFCNSLRMRAAMRIVNVAPDLSKSTIEEICQNPSKYPLLETSDENAYFYWQGTDPYFEPYYNDFRTRDDYGMSNIFVNHLKSTNDPRISAVMQPAETDNEYRGYENGALSAPSNIKTISRMGVIYRETPDGFTPLLKSCENYFIKAEAALLGWNVGTTAEEAYEQAVRISMEDNGIAEADADAYLAGAGKWDSTLERIYMEEWVALFKENCEAWSLYRRTGYPKEILTSGEYPGKFCIFGTAHNDVPFRMPYPNNEYLYNQDNINAAVVDIVDNTWGKQMWWDTRTNVH